MELYERIYNLCKTQKITGKELGEKLGLKKSPLTDWKNKKANPTVEQIIKMCDIFAVNSEYLLFGKSSVEKLTKEEIELIQAYRIANANAKEIIHVTLKPYLEQEKSSDSKIG